MTKLKSNSKLGLPTYVPGFLVLWKWVPARCGRKTPVPHDFWLESRKMACIPGPPDDQFTWTFGL